MSAVVAVLALFGCHGGDRPDPADASGGTGDTSVVGPDGPPTLIAASSDSVEVTYPDLAFAPDGTLWVSWVELGPNDSRDVVVARSDDGGRTFGDPIRADDADDLFLGVVRQPVLAVDAARVAIAVGAGEYSGDNSIRLYVAPADAPVFERRVLAEVIAPTDPDPSTVTLVDQPELMFDDAGELWLDWKVGTSDHTFAIAVARESAGYAPTLLDVGVRGQPCECCPTSFLQAPDGEVFLAFRNNDGDVREIWVAVARDGETFTEAFQVSTTGWVIAGCPLDGPSVALAGDTLVATWADASEGDNYQWFAVSHDGARVWTPSARVEPDNDSSMTWPQVVAGADGTAWTVVQEIQHQANVHSTDDDGATFVLHAADAPTGPVFFPEIAARPAGGVGLVGVTLAGELWYLEVTDAD